MFYAKLLWKLMLNFSVPGKRCVAFEGTCTDNFILKLFGVTDDYETRVYDFLFIIHELLIKTSKTGGM